jgi:hypothetical protein
MASDTSKIVNDEVDNLDLAGVVGQLERERHLAFETSRRLTVTTASGESPMRWR